MLKQKTKSRSTITNKLLSYFLILSLLPLTFLGFLTYSHFVETLKKEAIISLDAIADNKIHHIKDYIIERKKNIDTLARSPLIVNTMLAIDEAYERHGPHSTEYRAINEKIEPFLKYYMETYGYYNIIFPCIGKLECNPGNIVFSIKHGSDFGTSLVKGPYKDTELARIYNKVVNTLETDISEFRHYDPSGRPAAFIAAPVFKKGGLEGVLVAQISTEEIYELAQDYTGLGRTGEIVIAMREGDNAMVVAPLRYDPQAAFTRKIAIGEQKGLPIQKAVQGTNGSGLFIDYRGRETLAAWRYLPQLKWGIVVKIDAEEALAPVRKLATWFLLGGAITGLLVILAAIYISRAISGPIRILQKGMEIIGGGNLDHKTGTEARDEIGELSRSFDKMVGNLKAEISERKTIGDKLRTKAEVLSAINEIFRERINCETEEDLGKACLAVAEKLTNSKFGFLGELNTKGLFNTIAISNPGWDACNVPDSQASLIIKDMKISGIDLGAMREGRSRIVNGDEEFAKHPDHVGVPEGHPKLTAFLGVPFRQDNKIIGMIGLGNKEGGYTLEDQENIETLSIAIVESLASKRAADEKRHALELVVQSKQDWESTFNQITDMITIHDKDFNIITANKAAMETLKLPYVRSQPVKCFSVYHGTDSNPKGCPSCQCMKNKEPVSFETFEPHLNMFLEVRAMPRFDNNNEFSGIIHVVRDISERKKAENLLRKSEASLSEAQRIAHMGNWDWDIINNELAWSNEIYRIFGLAPQQFTPNYEAFLDSIHPDDRELVQEAVDEALNKEKTYSIDHRIILPGGTVRVVHEEANIIVDKEGKPVYMIGTVQDITERKQSEDKIKTQLEHLNALRSIDIAISSSLDLDVTLKVFLEQVIAQLHADAADVMLLNQDTMTLDYMAGKGFKREAIKQSSLELGEGYAGCVALERKAIIETDISRIFGKCKRTFLLEEENFKTYFGIPLIAKGNVKGVLEVYHRSPFEPDEEWFRFFEALAGQAAIALDNSIMFNEIQNSHEELLLAYETTIEGWARALDFRDKETEGHSRRVTNITISIARKIGFSDSELVHVRRGALLHDIGKLGVPDNILFKTGELTDKEWELMRRHPLIAYDILAPIPYLRHALDIPYCHHEKWDGSGYPRGLKGEMIPIAARIFAIVDVWDALISDRPYRPAWSKEKAREYIRSSAGIHLDPEIVEVFLKMNL